MYTEFEIRQIHLTLPRQRLMVERFLSESGLRLDPVDYYAGVFAIDGDEPLACGGLDGAVVKCIAVSPSLRDEGLSSRLVSHLICHAHEQGYDSVKLYTKPQNQALFESLGFRLLAKAPQAILMETAPSPLADYCNRLRQLSAATAKAGEEADGVVRQRESLTHGVIVMNANPFTLGHRYLIREAASRVDHLFVICVREDCSAFPYSERLSMIADGCCDIVNVTVVEGSDYAISATTFPTYFLKQLTDASDTQMTLDLDLFRRHLAPALGASVRFVGTEPADPLTQRYNELMHQLLGDMQVVELPRLASADGEVVSASAVRQHLADGHYGQAAQLVPATTRPFLLAHLACLALRKELDTTPKPGLVDGHDNGAHSDMDYALMLRSIAALRPCYVELARYGFATREVAVGQLQAIGMQGEKGMFAATGGVNTHKGALFALGLTIVAAAGGPEHLQADIQRLARQFAAPTGTHGHTAVARYGVRGALACAQDGYELLFAHWQPYYHSLRADGYACHKTLLCIMSELDDTNILHRTDEATAQWVKQQAEEALADFSPRRMEEMNRVFSARNISPGGSADMLALTIFIDSILN